MSYVINNKFVYLHIPKTGGTWLTEVLNNSPDLKMHGVGHKHSNYDYFCGLYGLQSPNRYARLVNLFLGYALPRNDDYQYFCVVRNPLKWYESWYQYQIGKKFRRWGEARNLKNWHVASVINDLPTDSFNNFMEVLIEKAPGFCTRLYDGYTYGSDAHVLKQENLRDEFINFAEENNLPINFSVAAATETKNVSKKIPLEWDREIFNAVVKFDSATFAKYNYDTDNIVKIST